MPGCGGLNEWPTVPTSISKTVVTVTSPARLSHGRAERGVANRGASGVPSIVVVAFSAKGTGGTAPPVPSAHRLYLAIAAEAAAIFAFTALRLKLAPFCIGGNSIA